MVSGDMRWPEPDCYSYSMTNTCRIQGCHNVTIGKAYRCPDHGQTCLAEGCDTVTESVRCSKHAGMYSRTGHSHVSCEYAGCRSKPSGDLRVCSTHRGNPSELQVALNSAYALLSQYGRVTFVLDDVNIPLTHAQSLS